jgi:hypothetical protein
MLFSLQINMLAPAIHDCTIFSTLRAMLDPSLLPVYCQSWTVLVRIFEFLRSSGVGNSSSFVTVSLSLVQPSEKEGLILA